MWPSDAIRWQGNESTLAQVMAWCLTAPSHYRNQCWLIISKVLWQSWVDLKILISKTRLKIKFLESHSDLTGHNELKIDIMGVSWEIFQVNATEPIDDMSTLLQVTDWCHQVTSRYLSQCWPRSISPYGMSRPQWIRHMPTFTESTQIHWNKNVILAEFELLTMLKVFKMWFSDATSDKSFVNFTFLFHCTYISCQTLCLKIPKRHGTKSNIPTA